MVTGRFSLMDVLTGCPSEVSARLQTPFNLQLNMSHWYYLSMKSVNGYFVSILSGTTTPTYTNKS